MQKGARVESSHVRRSTFSKKADQGILRAIDSFSQTMKKKKNPDPIDPQRSALMARVRQRHSAPELEVRCLLRRLGASYRLHSKLLPGTPDIVLPSAKCAIFVHGCFWHRHPHCAKATTPKTRVSSWTDKFVKNIARDARKTRALRKLGWSVMNVWECQCHDADKLTRRLKRILAR